MFEIKELENHIIVVEHTGEFSYDSWLDYQKIVLDFLDTRDMSTYILSDFRKTTTFAPSIVPEVGTARHLRHDKLGLIVLLGGTLLKNFILAIAENRAAQEQQSDRLRIQYDYDKAIDALRSARDQQAES